MYNGIGLPSARGSGSSGYVQKNLGFLPRKYLVSKDHGRSRQFTAQDGPARLMEQKSVVHPPNMDIIVHEQKRKIEVQCELLRDRLEEQGVGEEEIEKQVAEERERRQKEPIPDPLSHQMDTHEIRKRKLEQMEKLFVALKVNQKESARPNVELIRHEEKRQIEVKCEVLKDALEDQGLDEEEIEQNITEEREKLRIEQEMPENGEIDTPETRRQKVLLIEKMLASFNISQEAIEAALAHREVPIPKGADRTCVFSNLPELDESAFEGRLSKYGDVERIRLMDGGKAVVKFKRESSAIDVIDALDKGCFKTFPTHILAVKSLTDALNEVKNKTNGDKDLQEIADCCRGKASNVLRIGGLPEDHSCAPGGSRPWHLDILEDIIRSCGTMKKQLRYVSSEECAFVTMGNEEEAVLVRSKLNYFALKKDKESATSLLDVEFVEEEEEEEETPESPQQDARSRKETMPPPREKRKRVQVKKEPCVDAKEELESSVEDGDEAQEDSEELTEEEESRSLTPIPKRIRLLTPPDNATRATLSQAKAPSAPYKTIPTRKRASASAKQPSLKVMKTEGKAKAKTKVVAMKKKVLRAARGEELERVADAEPLAKKKKIVVVKKKTGAMAMKEKEKAVAEAKKKEMDERAAREKAKAERAAKERAKAISKALARDKAREKAEAEQLAARSGRKKKLPIAVKLEEDGEFKEVKKASSSGGKKEKHDKKAKAAQEHGPLNLVEMKPKEKLNQKAKLAPVTFERVLWTHTERNDEKGQKVSLYKIGEFFCNAHAEFLEGNEALRLSLAEAAEDAIRLDIDQRTKASIFDTHKDRNAEGFALWKLLPDTEKDEGRYHELFSYFTQRERVGLLQTKTALVYMVPPDTHFLEKINLPNRGHAYMVMVEFGKQKPR